MDCGQFKHRITIERAIESQDAGGTLSQKWQALPGFHRIPAEVLPDRASEYFAARQLQTTTNALIKLRYQPGIEPTMRVRHEKRAGLVDYYSIEGMIDLQERQLELRLFCLKRDAEGWRRGVDLVNR